MCTIDSLCVSSYSSACDSAALANAAVGAADGVTAAQDSRRPCRRHRLGRRDRRAAERRLRAGQRQADHVEDAELRGVDDIAREILVASPTPIRRLD